MTKGTPGTWLARLYDGAGYVVAKRADSPYRQGRTADWGEIRTPAGMDIQAERAKRAVTSWA
jgi:hypothetical protein